ncbi:MAG: anti-sigma factor domain-containing protein [Cyclobacteriaceae bacterium]
MNIEEYISSGVLETYALDELSAAEREEVEKNLQQYPALRDELARIEQTQEGLLMQAAMKPRAEVKKELFEKINKKPAGKIVPMVQEASSRWRYATAASVAIALLSSYLAYNYWDKWKKSESNLTDLIAQNQRIAQDYNNVNLRLDRIETDLKVTSNPDFTRVVMKGTPNSPQSLASVYWNAQTKEVYLSIQNIKELSKENQYQLWAIIDGKPVDCGVFDYGVAGLIKMKTAFASPVTFAVTVEPRGGKASPSLETMQVAGNLIKS